MFRHNQQNKRIWIDLCHTPHVFFFHQQIKALRERGYRVDVTVRECFQTVELAEKYVSGFTIIGRHWGKYSVQKILGILVRSFQLWRFALGKQIDLALSHGSPYQIIAASFLGIKSITFDDYEYANLTFPKLFSTLVAVPEPLKNNPVILSQIKKANLCHYPGIKENVYLPAFKPESHFLGDLGVNERNIIVTVRPPADKAHYHNPVSETLLLKLISYLTAQKELSVVILPRDESQKNSLQQKFGDRVLIPETALDGLSLIYYSDVVFSGGGTMNREAAVMNVPVYSFFSGKTGAVDEYLVRRGRLHFIGGFEDILRVPLIKRDKSAGQRKITNSLPAVLDIIESELWSTEKSVQV